MVVLLMNSDPLSVCSIVIGLPSLKALRLMFSKALNIVGVVLSLSASTYAYLVLTLMTLSKI